MIQPGADPEVDGLRTEITRLRAEGDKQRAEIERLRAEVKRLKGIVAADMLETGSVGTGEVNQQGTKGAEDTK